MTCDHCGKEMRAGPSCEQFPDCNTWRCDCGRILPEVGSAKLEEAGYDFQEAELKDLLRRGS